MLPPIKIKIPRELAAQLRQMGKAMQEEQRQLQRLMAPYAAQFKRASREMVREQRKFQRALHAAIPNFAELLAALDEDRKQTPHQVRTLARHGWYMPPDLTPGEARTLTESLDHGRATEVEARLTAYFDGRLDDIEATLCRRAPTRERFLRSALAAHRRGDYAAAIPLMLTQADGLCRDLTGNHLFHRHDKFKAHFQNVRPFVLALLSAVLEKMPLSAGETERAGKAGLFNRHAILHGESLDYDSAANSSRAISLLVYLSWALGEVHSATPRDGHDFPPSNPRPVSGQHPGRMQSKAAAPAAKPSKNPSRPRCSKK